MKIDYRRNGKITKNIFYGFTLFTGLCTHSQRLRLFYYFFFRRRNITHVLTKQQIEKKSIKKLYLVSRDLKTVWLKASLPHFFLFQKSQQVKMPALPKIRIGGGGGAVKECHNDVKRSWIACSIYISIQQPTTTSFLLCGTDQIEIIMWLRKY